jgi:hypothetical protein
MREPTLEILKSVCRNYRTKRYYAAIQSGTVYQPGEKEGSWCLLTQGPVGPDDSFVTCGECKPGRSCFLSRIPE